MSRKDFPIATAFEKTAKELSPEECFFGFLCWYCDANLIENGAKQAFIGINPAGKPNDADHDQEKGYPEKPYTDPGWNAFLDTKWDDWNPYQDSVPRLFEAMYGVGKSKRALRRTACFNVCPFRTNNSAALPVELKKASSQWFITVLKYVNPEFIICMGNAEASWSSPWAVLTRQFGIERRCPDRVSSLGYSLKDGTLESGPLEGVRVLGVPLSVLGKQASYLLPELLVKVQRIGQKRPFP